jgi:tetratricopeptide (TPR) repeat protein
LKRWIVVAGCLLVFGGCVSYQDMRARNAYLKGDLDTAERLTQSSLESDPKDLQALRLGAKIATKRGADALEKGDMQKARAYFYKAVELNPTDEVAQKYRDMIDQDLRSRIAD